MLINMLDWQVIFNYMRYTTTIC